MGFNIGRIFRGVTRALGGSLAGIAGNLFKGPLGNIVKPFLDKVGGLLEKGLGKAVGKLTEWAGKLGPLASLAQGPLGALGAAISKLNLSKLGDVAQNLISKWGGADNVPLPGIQNLTEMFAKRQADLFKA